MVGYGVAAIVKGPTKISVPSYESRPKARAIPVPQINTATDRLPENGHSGPGLVDRITETAAFEKVKTEAASIGTHFVDELSKKAKDVLVPAAMAWVTKWLESVVPAKTNQRNGVQ